MRAITTTMRSVTRCLVGAGLLAVAWGCDDATAPDCGTSCDAALVVYGRGTVSWSSMAVPGATVTVQLYADTTRRFGDCAGTSPFATATAALDTAGNYRVPLVIPGAASRWACVEVTGDPHNWASDVGIKHLSGGVVQLRAAPDTSQADSVRVDFAYSELP